MFQPKYYWDMEISELTGCIMKENYTKNMLGGEDSYCGTGEV